MAIDQDGVAEGTCGALDEAAQGTVIRFVEFLDPRDRFLHGEPRAVDFLSVGHHPRHRAEAAGDTHGPRVGERRKPPVEHARVELVGLAIYVEIGPWEVRSHERRAEIDHGREQAVDIGVFRAAERQRVEA